MPIYPGFHPYFKTTEKDLAYRTDAKSFLDYNDGKVKSLQEGLNLNGKRNPWSSLMQKKKVLSSRCRNSLSLCYWSMGLSFAMWFYGQKKGKNLFGGTMVCENRPVQFEG